MPRVSARPPLDTTDEDISVMFICQQGTSPASYGIGEYLLQRLLNGLRRINGAGSGIEPAWKISAWFWAMCVYQFRHPGKLTASDIKMERTAGIEPAS